MTSYFFCMCVFIVCSVPVRWGAGLSHLLLWLPLDLWAPQLASSVQSQHITANGSTLDPWLFSVSSLSQLWNCLIHHLRLRNRRRWWWAHACSCTASARRLSVIELRCVVFTTGSLWTAAQTSSSPSPSLTPYKERRLLQQSGCSKTRGCKAGGRGAR